MVENEGVVGGASTVGLLGSPFGHGPLLAATALFPGRVESFHVLVHTQRWAISPGGRLLFRQVGFSAGRFTREGYAGGGGVPQPRVLEFWDYQEMRRLASIEDFADCVRFSPDGRRLATDTEVPIAKAGRAGPSVLIPAEAFLPSPPGRCGAWQQGRT